MVNGIQQFRKICIALSNRATVCNMPFYQEEASSFGVGTQQPRMIISIVSNYSWYACDILNGMRRLSCEVCQGVSNMRPEALNWNQP
jgi:hypothetical protein